MDNCKRELRRTMSLTDIETSSLIRDVVERDLTVPADRSKHRFFLNLPKHDLVLPSLSRFDQDFRKFLLSALVDFALLKELESLKCLNWCPPLRKFLPLLTIADGNCLMNAASLSMWAINDRRLSLRRSIYQVLIEDHTDTFRNRWQLEQSKYLENQHGSSVDCSEEEWLRDWKNTMELASIRKSKDTNCYSGLEEIHIFTLSNVLRRPIIVLCDDILRGNYDESLVDVSMGGVYLPMLSDSVDCIKSPLVIGYHHGHFTSLVTTEDGSIDVSGEDELWQERSKNAVPLVKNDGAVLKIHFLLPDEEQNADRLLREYLHCSKVEYSENGANKTVLVAEMQSQEPEEHLHHMIKTYFDALQAVYLEKLAEKMSLSNSKSGQGASPSLFQTGKTSKSLQLPTESVRSCGGMDVSTGSIPCCGAHKRCKTSGCENYTTQSHGLCYQCEETKKKTCTSPDCEFLGDPSKQGLCSVCFARYHAILEQQEQNMPLPSAPPSNMCRNEDCHELSNPNLHNLCLKCYLKTVRDGDLEQLNTDDERPSISQASNTSIASLPTNTVPNEVPPQHETPASGPVRCFSRQTSLFCLSQYCHNKLQDHASFYCDECKEHMVANISSEPHNELPAVSGSYQPNETTSSSLVFNLCSVSCCNMPAVTYHGELCLAHYKESQSQSIEKKCDHTKEAEGIPCVNPGCQFFAIPEHSYLCSRCHSKALQEEYDRERNIHQRERARAEQFAQQKQMSRLYSATGKSQFGYLNHDQNQLDGGPFSSSRTFYQTFVSSRSSSSAPPSPNPRKRWSSPTGPCKTHGCPRLGTEENKGQCDICFKKLGHVLSQGSSGRSRFCSTP